MSIAALVVIGDIAFITIPRILVTPNNVLTGSLETGHRIDKLAQESTEPVQQTSPYHSSTPKPMATNDIVANASLEFTTTAPTAPFAAAVEEPEAAEADAVVEAELLAAAWKAAKVLAAPVVSLALMAKTIPLTQWLACLQ